MARQVLQIPDVPATLLQAATAAATYLPLTGGTLTGPLTVSGATGAVRFGPQDLSGDTYEVKNLDGNMLSLGPVGQTGDATLRVAWGETFLRGYLYFPGSSSDGIMWHAGENLFMFRQAANTLGLNGHFVGGSASGYDLGTLGRRWRDLHLGGAVRWGPGTAAADATIQRTGVGALRLDKYLGVGAAPAAWAASELGVVQVGTSAYRDSNVGFNTYYDGTNNRAIATGAALSLSHQSGQLYVYNAPSVAAGATQVFTLRQQMSAAGTLTLSPDAATNALSITGLGTLGPGHSTNLAIGASGSGGAVEIVSTGLVPYYDNYQALGVPTQRWATIYAVNPTIQTSHVSRKEGFARLDPPRCAEAVLETDWFEYDYKPAAGDDDAVFRHQRGYVLGSPEHKTHDLFGLADRYSASTHADLAVVACALQDALTRIAQLEARPA